MFSVREICVLQAKGRDIKHLALASLGLDINSEQKVKCLQELKSLDISEWYRCEFRHCDLLLIYGGDRVLEKTNISWTPSAERCPALRVLIEEIVSPYFHVKPRIIVLRTKQKEQLNWHVDCNHEELDEFRPKLRCLLSGQRDDLFYLAKNGVDKIYAPIFSDVYYMSGAYVHSLKNESMDERYVLCFGSPWTEKDLKPYFLETLNKLDSSHVFWSDELLSTNRKRYVRDPSRHGLNPYGTP